MSFEDIRAALKKQTKSVRKTYNFVLLFVFVLSAPLLMMIDWKTDKFNSQPDSEFIHCKDTIIGDVDDNGVVEFTVLMWNPYNREGTFVGKLPAEKSDSLVLFGNGLVWSGTFDSKGNEFPSPIIYFQNGKDLDNSTRRHYYTLNCPSLKPQLDEAALNWSLRPVKPEDTLPTVEKDMIYGPQETDEITCRGIAALPPIGAHGTTDVAVFFGHPYEKDVLIHKYPMSGNETIVMHKKYAIWYGSFILEDHEKFPTTLISFQKTLPNGVTRRHYYNLTCPILEKELEELTEAWWNQLRAWMGSRLVLTVLSYTALGCLFGLARGDFLARRAILKKMQLA